MLMLAIMALAAQDKPYAGELMERLNAPVKATLESSKKSYDLEICVADALTILGTPTVFRQGPEDVVVAVSLPTGNAFLGAVSIIRTASGSRLDLRVRGKSLDDRIRDRLSQCL